MKPCDQAWIALLLLPALCEPGWALVCGSRAARPGHLPARGEIRTLAVFARFQDEDTGSREAPEFAAALFDPQRPGSLTHFYTEMSRGQFRLEGEALPRWYTAKRPASAYVDTLGQSGDFGAFSRDILAAVDAEIDLGHYDDDGPDGVPNSGDDDGYVDFLFLNTLTIPKNFIIADATGVAQLGLSADYLSNDNRRNGGLIRVRADDHPRGPGGTLQRAHTFAIAAGSMAHEFGHILGLPDLYDLDYSQEDGEPDPEKDSAGLGYWCLMGRGALGWNDQGGPNPLCAWSLGQLGWIGTDNSNLVIVREDLEDVVLEDVNAGGKVYKLPTADPAEYFLVEYRRPGNSYYERGLPGSGLLIWHVNQGGSNNTEQNKLVDLVCADGLYQDAGFPAGLAAAPELGRDNLDFWAHDPDYAAAHYGNLGDATDVYDGVNFTEFSPISNPSSPAGISVTNIRPQGERMVADLNIHDRRRAGAIQGEEVWQDTVEVVGDVVVEPGGRLRIAPGTVVRFGPDQRHTGPDPQRCALVVYGELIAEGSGRGRVVLTSAASAPRPGDWYGIALQPAGQLSLRQAALDYAHEALAGQNLLFPVEVEDTLIRQAGQCGICLAGLQAPVWLTGLEVSQTTLDGVRLEGPALVRVQAARLLGNGRSGLERRGGFLECLNSEFAGNGLDQSAGANLLLGEKVFGRVAQNRFSGGVGIRCLQAEEVVIERNRLADHRIGLVNDSARPHVLRNEFIDNELVFQFSGFLVPARLELNAVQDAGQLLDNQTQIEIFAANNWWGQDDETWIRSRIKGPVQWHPFLNFDPRAPVDFALGQNYPNPFNGSTVIAYTVGINQAALSRDSQIVVEVRTLTGGLVRRLVQQPASPGIYSVVWDGSDDQGEPVASGVYYYQLRVDPVQVARKLMVLR